MSSSDKPTGPNEAAAAVSFEQALQRLEEIVHELEDGQTGLAESLARYEEGVKLLKLCYTTLESAERRIELCTGIDAEGNPITEAFDDTAASASLEEKAEARGRRRSQAVKSPRVAKPSADAGAGENDIDEARGLF